MSSAGQAVNSPNDVRASLVTDAHERFVYENFKGHFAKRASAANDGEPTGTAGNVNVMIGDRNCFEYHIIGTQDILGPIRTNAGLNICLDAVNNDGLEITLGNEQPADTVISDAAGATRGTFVVGTDKPFAFSFKASLADVSGADEYLVGFRKAEAYRAVIEDDYDEMAAFNVMSGDINISTILNGGTTSNTDTTNNWADTETKTLTVIVDSDGSLFGTARAVYYEIDGVAPTTVPTTLFKFDSGEIVIPFVAYRHDSEVCDTIIAKVWQSGFVGVGETDQLGAQ